MVNRPVSTIRTRKLITRRNFVTGSGAALIGASTVGGLGLSGATAAAKNPYANEMSLRERASKTGLYFGAAIMADQLRNDKAFREAVIRECNALVHENELKWVLLSRREGEYDFRNADYIADFADKHGMVVRGTPLVWYISNPKYVLDKINKNNARDMMEAHIKTVLGRYKGRFHSWDVVNEVLHQDEKLGNEEGLRKTFWLDALGPEYLEMAFETAAQVDPDATLIFNDHAVTYGREEHEKRRRIFVKWIKQLTGNGIPIHGIGIQAHLSIGRHPFNADELRRFLDDMAELGMRINVTELDVNDRNAPADLSVRDQIAAEEYGRFLEVFTTHPAVDMIITWGISDKYTWLNDYVPRLDGLPQRSLPLDHKMRRKETWHALAQAFDRRTGMNEL